MAYFEITPIEGDSFSGYYSALTHDRYLLDEEIKEGIDACIQSGVRWATAKIGDVKKPVRGAKSGERLNYTGHSRSWASVRKWMDEIEAEETAVYVPLESSCLGRLVFIALLFGAVSGFFCLIGLGFIPVVFFQFVWTAIVTLLQAIWVGITEGHL